ncbi:MAG: endonuclease [Methanothermococcus sp.]|jgi:endonuclease-3|uniref:DUF123 domain-containing protein n=1 Tax=Methanothermococcus TaxID=155862 RepID=UPI0003627FAC|nr:MULTISPECIES: DUF123 domain-containing protein [Methanothermococcus]MDK2791111.1 endonuclease [Methanothermococcus sp.]MDK2988256.1 endonuclease [Methanothermococcus sp.]
MEDKNNKYDSKSNFEIFLDILNQNLNKNAVVNEIASNTLEEDEMAFKVLVSTILSARTKDETTEKVSKELFKKVKSPEDLINIDLKELENLVYPSGFYRTKAKNLKKLGEILVKNYNSKVPKNIEELVKLPGVGRKTANLVVTLAFDNYGICVDTHVHRICNRWDYVNTDTPEETEMELRKKLHKKYWKEINNLLVVFGREICSPVPKCKTCYDEVRKICPYYEKLSSLENVLKTYGFIKTPKSSIPKDRGTYVLKIKLNSSKNITFKKNRETQKFKKGYYFYVGSAMGSSVNLYNRINRHLSKEKNKHWHIDYLLEFGNIKEIYISKEECECETAKELSRFLDPIKGFGCSDCKCESHLFYLKP